MNDDLKVKIQQLFAEQNLAVLATSHHGQPYTSLVAFAASEDLRQLLFVTARATRKFDNLSREPRVSLLIDNRSNRGEDFREAMAVTAIGLTAEVPEAEHPALLSLFLEHHPLLRDFAEAPSCALMRVTVQRYIQVSRFQNLLEWSFE